MKTQKTLTGYFFIGLIMFTILGSVKNVSASSFSVNIWWPKDQVTVSGVRPFKAVLTDSKLGDYKMYWQVDSGSLVEMRDSYTDYPHKEASVDVNGWNWSGNNSYNIKIVAKNSSGSVIAENSSVVHMTGTNKNNVSTVSAISTVSKPTSSPTVSLIRTNTNFVPKTSLYTDPYSVASGAVTSLRRVGRYDDANLMNKIASSPTSKWFGGWNGDIFGDVNKYVSQANSSGALPVLVAYNIPGRDCGSYSAGGSKSSDSYRNWIKSFADGIGNKKAIVILEPDSLAQLDCLSSAGQSDRLNLINYAVGVLKSNQNTSVYLDAGNPTWKSASDMASVLKKAGIEKSNGFSLNVSNFISLDQNKTYGKQVSALVNNKHFMIDTSRNGSGSNGEWCNPSGRSLGIKPTRSTGDSLIDAYLWIKQPGESDGSCNGGPSAGVFWESYALDLARRASW